MQINNYNLNFSEAELDQILENKTRNIELISKDFKAYQDLPDGDKKALEHLIRAAEIINDVALEQDHPLNAELKKALALSAETSSHAAKALQLFNSLNGVAGFNGEDPKPVQIFKEISLLPGRNFYPKDLSVTEFHNILLKMAELGQIETIRQILCARTMVRRDGELLKAIDYTKYFEKQFSDIANELEAAAYYATEHEFKDFLSWQAQAFLQNNPDMDMLADKHWAVLQNNRLEFTISRENYEDEMTGTVFDNPELVEIIRSNQIDVVAKDTLGARVGLVNKEGTQMILDSKKTLSHLAHWMPLNEQYTQQSVSKDDLKQTMADVDLITLSGDYAMCRGGITTAQNLPNGDKLSVKTGGGRRNVYHRQVRLSTDKPRTQKLLDALVSKELHPYFDQEKLHDFVIGHENGHSLGPDNSYKDSLGSYRHIIEELKADIVSVAAMSEIADTFNTYDLETLKKIYTTWAVSLFLKARPVSEPHRIADLIQFNYCLSHGVFRFGEDQKLNIDFEKLPHIMYTLLEEIIKVQLSKSAPTAKNFIERYTEWGKWSKYIADVQKSLGTKPYIRIITNF